MLSGGTQRRAFPSTPERRNENINVNKYFISSSGDRTHIVLYNLHFIKLHHSILCKQRKIKSIKSISNTQIYLWGSHMTLSIS